MKIKPYTIQFTRGELIWLGRAFNVISFPLLPPLGDSLSLANLDNKLASASKSLTERGLVKIESKGKYKIETLAYSVIDWLIQPDCVYSIETLEEEHKKSVSTIYIKEKKVLQLVIKDDVYMISLFPDKVTFADNLFAAYSNTKIEVPKTQEIRLPVASPFDLIQLASASDEKSIQALRVAGFSTEQATTTTQWLKKIRHVCLISQYCWESGVLKLHEENMILQDEDFSWHGQSSKDKAKFLILKPIQFIENINGIVH